MTLLHHVLEVTSGESVGWGTVSSVAAPTLSSGLLILETESQHCPSPVGLIYHHPHTHWDRFKA